MNNGQSPEESSPEFSNKIQEDVLYLYQHAIPVDYTLLTFPLWDRKIYIWQIKLKITCIHSEYGASAIDPPTGIRRDGPTSMW